MNSHFNFPRSLFCNSNTLLGAINICYLVHNYFFIDSIELCNVNFVGVLYFKVSDYFIIQFILETFPMHLVLIKIFLQTWFNNLTGNFPHSPVFRTRYVDLSVCLFCVRELYAASRVLGTYEKNESKYYQSKIKNLKNPNTLFRSMKDPMLLGYNNSQTKITLNQHMTVIRMSSLQSFSTWTKY